MTFRFGYFLKEFRINNKLSQEQLAMKLGMSQAAISNYERVNRSPSLVVLSALRKVFGLSIDELIDELNRMEDEGGEVIHHEMV